MAQDPGDDKSTLVGNGLVPGGTKPVDPDLCRHMASLGYNGLRKPRIYLHCN